MDFVFTILSRFYELIGVTGLLIGGSTALCIVLVLVFINGRLNVFRKAVRHYEKGNFNKALFYVAIELQKHPSHRQATLLKARIASKNGAYPDAEKGFFRLIDLKRPGDGIDAFEIKTELLAVLYAQQKIYETYRLCKEILEVSHTNAEALYYMGLIFLGQLHYKEAEKVLMFLIRNRPRHHEASCAACVAAAQLGGFDRAEDFIRKSLDIEKKPLYILLHAAVLFFLEKYSQALSLLDFESDGKRHFQKRAQLLFSMRLKAFCHYKLANYEKASKEFRNMYFTFEEPEGCTSPLQEHIGTYNELGRVQKAPRTENMSEIRVQNDAIRDYYHLKEVSIEAGKGKHFRRDNTSSLTRLLNLEGLGQKTWAALDVGFSLVKGRLYSEAKAFFQEVHERHPEVLGLKRVIEMIDEKSQKDAPGTKQKEGLRGAEKSTKKILEKKSRSFELWEYVEAWEKTVVRPYHMVHAAGYTARVQLKPSLLMMKDGRFPWQL